MSDSEHNTRSKRLAKNDNALEQPETSANSPHQADFPIVGVGASAGGLEAFIELLKAMNTKLGVAFVLVPHLEPTHESAMTEFLSRATQMPVLQVKEGVQVEPDHVYVIPPGKEMIIRDGILHLSPRGIRPSMPIDIFLRSLAEDRRHNAIGIILSGTASDGTLGLRAIKGEGGITFAQDPRSAKFDSMPRSAIASGAVDVVMNPTEIADELKRIRQHPYVTDAHEAAFALDDGGSSLEHMFRLLKQVSKVDFSDYKAGTIRRRVLRRMALKEIKNLKEYVAFLRQNPAEVEALYQDILINVTSLFRNPQAFESLKRIVYPALVQNRAPGDTLRIWVPGCSTGEEVYSHAIALFEYLNDHSLGLPLQVFGTDLSETAIQHARSGIYKQSIAADVSPSLFHRYFSKVEDGGYQISKSIRDVCIFARQNVFSDPPFSKMDIVSCRNLLIYLGPALQKRVVPIFHYALRPGGFLMLGNTESLLISGQSLFDLVDKKNKIYSKRPGPTPVDFGFTMNRSDTVHPAVPPDPAKHTPAPKGGVDLQKEADRLLLTNYVPAAVLVNAQLDILQSRGQASRYLELSPGKASLNLLRMARPGLLFKLQKAVEDAAKEKKPIRRDNIPLETSGDHHLVSIEVLPLPASPEPHFLIVFHDEPVEPPAKAAEAASGSQDKNSQVEHLEQELAAAKQYLQSIIEEREAANQELQVANEEIQSGNEELQSTNEELQTSKEELESANEELNTVNEEMQHRNQQLTQLNNDLTNLLNSVNLPIVMLGPDLSIRRFTTQAEKLLGLLPIDVGRPIAKVGMRGNITDLEHGVLDVMRAGGQRQIEFKDEGGVAYDLRIAPYRTIENKVDGAVMVFLDPRSLSNASSRPPESGSHKPQKK
jgi:two-component system, chemotaxis family, CheB/CheR fusion protein